MKLIRFITIIVLMCHACLFIHFIKFSDVAELTKLLINPFLKAQCCPVEMLIGLKPPPNYILHCVWGFLRE